MSKLIIVVNGAVYGSTSSFRALHYVKAAIAAKHEVIRVFFYQEGVTNTSSFVNPASDEFDLVAAWQTLAASHQIELINCVSAALRRGILSPLDATENGKQQWNLANHFTMGGLGELVTGIETADRVVSF